MSHDLWTMVKAVAQSQKVFSAMDNACGMLLDFSVGRTIVTHPWTPLPKPDYFLVIPKCTW